MRKYAIPKVLYIFLATILLCLSVGYTYAYFSAIHTASSTVSLGKVNVIWRDANMLAPIQQVYDDSTTDKVNEAMSIQIMATPPSDLDEEELENYVETPAVIKRGEYLKIRAKNYEDNVEDVLLEIYNGGTISTYCRIKVKATYIPENSTEEKDCGDDWFKLALWDGEDYVFITDFPYDENTWVFNESDGYYYHGTKAGDTYNLIPLDARLSKNVADYIYLSETADSEILGAEVSIVLILEGIQTTNDAYIHEWDINTHLLDNE